MPEPVPAPVPVRIFVAQFFPGAMAKTQTATKKNVLPKELTRAIELAIDRKGVDMMLLDLRGLSNSTDYFLLVNGTSDTHVRSIAEHVEQELKKEGVTVAHVEGLTQGRWVLLDYVDFVVHVFHPTLREFYQLERLWSDAKVIPVDQQGD